MTEQSNTDHLITLVDLKNILTVFDLASTRGAFKAAELQPVGELFAKIDNFIKAAETAGVEPTPALAETTTGKKG